MKRVNLKTVNRKTWLVITVLCVGVLVAAGYFAIYNYGRHDEEAQQVLDETSGIPYSSIDPDTATKRSQAVFGKDIDKVETGDLTTKDKALEAGRLFASKGEGDKSIAAFEKATSLGVDGLNGDDITAYVNMLDDADRHSDATALYQKQLDLLKATDPNNTEQIEKIESKIINRKELFP